jgi:outer membrane lipoprotein SlyB
MLKSAALFLEELPMTVTSFSKKSAVKGLLLASLLATSVTALADPPAHAPAHGWRKKNDARYVGYTGGNWERDFGVIDGRCDRDAVGAVLGGVAGGVIGSQIGEGSGRTVAIIAGTVLGAVIGHEIGERMDEKDRACMGHALELAKDGVSVRWSNPAGGIAYVLTPVAGKTKDSSCRNFKLQATGKGKSESRDARACRKGDGTWELVKR